MQVPTFADVLMYLELVIFTVVLFMTLYMKHLGATT